MELIIFDTDIIIWILRGKETIVTDAKRLSEETSGKIYITPIQVAEVYSGMTDKEERKTRKLIESFYFLDINKRIGELAGIYINKYRKSHQIELADAIIGASAKNYNLNYTH
ncbi:MAG: type II toxin-antitoxin system VapC family toxin [Candidatus Acidulodesulfobacterium acidiphilum]|uniref:Type II toxin-antitoxin system VapC family toxin n=1 Tax=Candidatus Acidulodesulfobacterium acidiphilum TaxID=2597224 RepID=A0A520XHF9_9DELT|nr:MAG: type II toxin-antitoxin system VapC family toxin [Candidatus Acidulodesulfobacterium acidiphilum]